MICAEDATSCLSLAAPASSASFRISVQYIDIAYKISKADWIIAVVMKLIRFELFFLAIFTFVWQYPQTALYRIERPMYEPATQPTLRALRRAWTSAMWPIGLVLDEPPEAAPPPAPGQAADIPDRRVSQSERKST